jgi:predicted RNA-binding protein associated with RNAse of E/G family
VRRQTSATIIERKVRLDGSREDYVCDVLALDPGRHAILRYVLDREWVIANGALHVPKGAWTVSHYWSDRPYNVYHWLVEGRTLAYYCNVATDTTVAEDLVAYTDLTVDVLLRPSGAASVLDEDELPPDLEPRFRIALAKALEALIADPRGVIREVERATADALHAT